MFQIRTIITKFHHQNQHYFSSHHCNVATELALNILQRHGFTESQGRQALSSIESLLRPDTYDSIARTINSWKRNVLPRNYSDHVVKHEDFKQVFYQQESRLLLVDEEFIENRIYQLKNLDLIRGQNDLWRAFHQSPAGFFLQDWQEFLKKYYYITFKILPWLNPDNNKNDQIHPLIRHPQSIEQSYMQIKTRFTFAQRTGFKVAESKNVNLKTLLLFSEKDFLRIYSPYCTIEEFEALEKLHSTELGIEDDKLFEDLVKLSPKGQQSTKKANNNSFMKKGIEEGMLLSN
ncbi:hypothetical protein BLA29_000536 [Euroglyphus maynei]|uniref:Uncharacterized protein n=1 Tax=Euroglyphus maynei TaxID=6958 RepID=A0A1Y3BDS3_EURMA|nr:hypothetical protein BLA29_000536 [Euroglyphus maynei]